MLKTCALETSLLKLKTTLYVYIYICTYVYQAKNVIYNCSYQPSHNGLVVLKHPVYMYMVCYATDERIVPAQRVNESRCVTFWPTTAAAAALLLLYEHPAAFQPGQNYVTPLYYRPVYIRGLCGPRLDTREQRFNRIAPQPRNDIYSLPLPCTPRYRMGEDSPFHPFSPVF